MSSRKRKQNKKQALPRSKKYTGTTIFQKLKKAHEKDMLRHVLADNDGPPKKVSDSTKGRRIHHRVSKKSKKLVSRRKSRVKRAKRAKRAKQSKRAKPAKQSKRAKRAKQSKRAKRKSRSKRAKRAKQSRRVKRKSRSKRAKRKSRSKRAKRAKQSRRVKRKSKVGPKSKAKAKAKAKSKSKSKAKSKSKSKCKSKWKTLEHGGVLFPEEYEPLNIPLLYGKNKKEIFLNPEAEEAALFYAKVLATEHIKNPVFRTNFFNDWKKLLPRGIEIKSLKECDFSNFVDFIETERDEKKGYTKSKKSRIKESKEKHEKKYTTAIVDGKKQTVGNFRVEPPGLFLGRGKHPKAGKIKRRIQPEDIIINIGKKDKIPKPPDGHEWGAIVNDHCAIWLASWKENINGDNKYVWLDQTADFKKQSDESKFELARVLKNNFDKIRKENMENIMTVGSGPSNDKLHQLAVALYLIDTLVLRVGNEKGADEADTVGVASLRVEHIKLLSHHEVELDFLGKDSVRFNKKFTVPKDVYRLLEEFTKGKPKSAPLFDKIQAKDINQYLKGFMPGLTAKVFRTANASHLFQEELDKIKSKKGEKATLLINKLNKANAAVAILCNHKKKIAKNYAAGLEKIKEQISNAKDKLKELKKKNQTDAIKKQIKNNKAKQKELKARLDTRQHMKEVATGTAKINYIDPRITAAFIKKHDLGMDKVFNKQQQKKFAWAMNVGSNWKF